jgi:hypothetical protein
MTATSLPTLDPNSALTFGGAATATSTFTASPEPTSTLPPLPDFPSTLFFSPGGGEDIPYCARFGDMPIPAVYGEAFTPSVGGMRAAMLCLRGFPAQTPLHVTMLSPEGDVTLEGDFMADYRADSWQMIWMGHYEEEYFSRFLEDGTIMELHLWWPGDLPSGTWQVHVGWDGGETYGTFGTPEKQSPQLFLFDPRYRNEMLISLHGYIMACHRLANNYEFNILGESYYPNVPVYILVYEDNEGYDVSDRLVFSTVLYTDEAGKFWAGLPSQFETGKQYLLIGITDLNAPLTDEWGLLNYETIGSAIDCFVVP